MKPGRLPFSISAVMLLILASGCRGPSKANIQLRKQNQELRKQVESLQIARSGDDARIRALEQTRGTLQTLPQDRLAPLFTAHGLEFGRLTGGADLDRDRPGDEALKVYVTPTDETKDTIKAAGSVTVEAFDLTRGPEAFLGKWEFDIEQSRKLWHSGGLLYGYVLTCPWQQEAPSGENVRIRVIFLDALTNRQIEAQRDAKVRPPEGFASTSPAANPQ